MSGQESVRKVVAILPWSKGMEVPIQMTPQWPLLELFLDDEDEDDTPSDDSA